MCCIAHSALLFSDELGAFNLFFDLLSHNSTPLLLADLHVLFYGVAWGSTPATESHVEKSRNFESSANYQALARPEWANHCLGKHFCNMSVFNITICPPKQSLRLRGSYSASIELGWWPRIARRQLGYLSLGT